MLKLLLGAAGVSSSTADRVCDLCESWDKDRDTFLTHWLYHVTVILDPQISPDDFDPDVAFRLRELGRGMVLCRDCLVDTLDGLLSDGVI